MNGSNLLLQLAGGGTVGLNGVRAHWNRSSADVAPQVLLDRAGAPGARRYGAGTE